MDAKPMPRRSRELASASEPHTDSAAPAAPEIAPAIRVQQPVLPAPANVMRYFEASRQAGFYANGGPCARELARRLEDYLGNTAFCVPVANCTIGLMAALRVACGAPDAARPLVLTPSYTFTATACAIEWAGFEPVFVDVEPDGWHVDPQALEEALELHGGRVAGVLACATFGAAPAADQRAAWRAACERHGVPLLIDSAPGFGALDETGRPLGSQGDAEVFSFHATKPFAIGEGGLITTPDPQMAADIGRILNFGLEPGTRVSTEVGFNGKLSELHAATGLAMLDMLSDVLTARRGHAATVRALLRGTGVTAQRGAHNSTWQFLQLVLPDAATRERLVAAAPAHAIEVRTLHDPPLHRHPAFAHRVTVGDLPVTEDLARRSISLPMANRLEDAQLERIAALVRAAL
jgi:dTDP-4-amino-4,6-dideoxygalactose transaminase